MEPRFRVTPQFWQNFLLGCSALIIGIFSFQNRQGLKTLVWLMRDALVALPDLLKNIIDYFANVPDEQLAYSLLIGGVFGGVSTALITVLQHRKSPIQPSARLRWFSGGTGVITGAIGSQILLYPTQHCTYAPGSAGAEFRMGVVVTVLSALLLLVPLWTVMLGNPLARRAHMTGYFRGGYGLPYLFVLPTLVFLALFLYYPAVQIMGLSLKRKIFPLPQEQFACMQNYVSLSEDVVYRNSFATTLFITFFIVLLSLLISLGIAVLASQRLKGIAVYRTLLIWPYAISPIVTGVVFLSMFRESGAGVLNWLLGETLGIEPHWLTDRTLAPWVIIAASLWNLLGFNVLFYIAGLQNIPKDLLEAASLDGAGRFRRFWRITFPLLSPFTFFLLVTNVMYAFYGIYGVVETLTPAGGPRFGPGGESGATEVLIFKLYNDAFKTGAPAGLGAAQAVVLFLMVAGLTLLQFQYIERRVSYEV